MLKHTDMPVQSQGLLNEFWPAHQQVVDAMDKRLTHLVELLGKSRDALHGTTDYYRNTDTRNAARLDATYPTVARTGYEMPGGRPLSQSPPAGSRSGGTAGERWRSAARNGDSVDEAFAHVLRFREGRICELVQITDTASWPLP